MEQAALSVNKRQLNAYRLLRPFASLAMKIAVNFDCEQIPEVEGPYLLLANHNTDLDPFLLAVASKPFIRFVATEKLARMGFAGKLARRYCNPILHFKGKQGLLTVRSILSDIKKGTNVAMFPEGNRSFNGLTCSIPAATAKLARTCKGTLVTYRLSGGYFTSPRWGKGLRRGKLCGRVAGVYTHEMLKDMSDEEILALINRDLYVDAYADQKRERIAFKGKNRAVGLESTLFLCPVCKKLSSLKSHENLISCECGYTAEYDEFGYLVSKDSSDTITDLDRLQDQYLDSLIERSGDRPVFSDTVCCESINADHSVLEKKDCELVAYSDRLVVGGSEIKFEDLEGIAVNQRNLLIIHIHGGGFHYECSGPVSFSALKYLYLVRKKASNLNGVF